jgi:hypothetical protein
MSLEQAISSVKKAYPLWQPWNLGKRKSAIKRLETLSTTSQGIDDFLGKITNVSVADTSGMFFRDYADSAARLEQTLDTLEEYQGINPLFLSAVAETFNEQVEDIARSTLWCSNIDGINPYHPLYFDEVKTLVRQYTLVADKEGGKIVAQAITKTLRGHRYRYNDGFKVAYRDYRRFVAKHLPIVAFEGLGIKETPYLLATFDKTPDDDKKALVDSWRTIMADIETGRFDPEDLAHRNLGYTCLVNAIETEGRQFEAPVGGQYFSFDREYNLGILRGVARDAITSGTYVLGENHIIESFAANSYAIDWRIMLPLVRNVVVREKSAKRITRLAHGLHSIADQLGLSRYFSEAVREEFNLGYQFLTDYAMVQPLIDDQAKEAIDTIFAGRKSGDDVAYYQHLMQVQGRKVKRKSLDKVRKLKEQITRLYREDGISANPTMRQMREEREQKVRTMLRAQETAALHMVLQDVYQRAVENVTGRRVAGADMNEDIVNAVLLYQEPAVDKPLLADIVNDVFDGNPQRIYEREANKQMKESYEEKGIDMDAWLNGITRTYAPEMNQHIRKSKEETIAHHRAEARAIYQQHGYIVTDEDIFDRYEEVKDDLEDAVRRDLKTQLQAIRSLEKATYNSKVGEITIYAEQDPLKVLQMGNVVQGSCLALGKGNAWSTVANVADINKVVLYVEMDGEIIGRKLIALNENGELVQFRTYNNRIDIDFETPFRTYLTELSERVGAPLGNGGTVPRAVSRRWYDDKIVPFNPNMKQELAAK